jgi:translation initiation factor 4G
VAAIATSAREHFAHVSGFVIAEIDGAPVGALSGYAPAVKKTGHFVGALDRTLQARGWSEAHRLLLGKRILPAVAVFSENPTDRWIVEWVALRPEARGKGIAAELLAAILDRGRAQGFTGAQITYLIGNEPARRTYERAGFVEVDRKCDPGFQAIFDAEGTARMWKEL